MMDLADQVPLAVRESRQHATFKNIPLHNIDSTGAIAAYMRNPVIVELRTGRTAADGTLQYVPTLASRRIALLPIERSGKILFLGIDSEEFGHISASELLAGRTSSKPEQTISYWGRLEKVSRPKINLLDDALWQELTPK